LEYQRGRTRELLSQLGLAAKLEKLIDSAIDAVEKERRATYMFAVNALVDPVKQELEAIKKGLQENREDKPDLMTGDLIFDALTELFDDKVGGPYKPEEYKEIYKKGKERYDAEIPPGYKDKSKDPADIDQYGDLVLWLQLIDYAKVEARPITLVTDDAKEDWWLELRGETLGPRVELREEFMRETGGKWFYMYSTEQFLRHATKYLHADIKPEVIKEAEGINKQDAEKEKQRRASVGVLIPGLSAGLRAEAHAGEAVWEVSGVSAVVEMAREQQAFLDRLGLPIREMLDRATRQQEMVSSVMDGPIREMLERAAIHQAILDRATRPIREFLAMHQTMLDRATRPLLDSLSAFSDSLANPGATASKKMPEDP
jgi:hypothetical protein